MGEASVGGLRGDPVILLGMHNSGTSIFAEVLHRHGVFMHANMDHFESRFFTLRLNRDVIMGGARDGWARVPIMSVDEVMAKLERARREIEKKAKKKYVRSGYDGHGMWGFKDPRTCVTLPLYLEIFPRARLLHIVRQEADVAESLAGGRKQGVGVLEDREHWRVLYRQYVERVREFGVGRDYHEFAYEDFCRSPIDVTKPIFDRLDLPFTPELEDFLRERVHTRRIDIATPPEG